MTIGYVELLAEMIAKKKGKDRRRWRLVLSLESIKLVFPFQAAHVVTQEGVN